jgi:hypothetical protein
MLGQKSLAPKFAALFDIPLVFYGENEAEYGNPVQDNNAAQRDWSYFSATAESDLFLSGTSITELKEEYGLNDVDLAVYMPREPDVIREKKYRSALLRVLLALASSECILLRGRAWWL